METVHRRVNGGLQETTEHASRQSACSEQPSALTEFAFGVPRTQDILSPGEDARLKVPLEETDSHEVLRCSRNGIDHGEHCPRGNHGREEMSRFEVGEEEVVWNNAAEGYNKLSRW